MKKEILPCYCPLLAPISFTFSILTSNVTVSCNSYCTEIENTNNIPQEETVPIDTSDDILEEGISTSVFEETEVKTEVETEKEVIIEGEVVEPPFVFEFGNITE